MNFKLSEEQLLIQKTAKEFAETELAPGVVERDEKKIWPKESVIKIAELGFMGMMTDVKPKRARTKGGKYKADDKSTKEFNEAWVGGKAPKPKRRKALGTKNKTKQTKK